MRDRFEEIKGLNLPQFEDDILARWDRERIFQRSLEVRAGAPVFSFYEGPPTANGQPGIHHLLGRTVKDIFCRYRTMKGYRVERKAGWDTHGLPVEIEVEKELGLEGRNQVEQYGIARYNAACRASVLRYKEDWDRLTRRLGYWVDLEHPYITFEARYIESVWWLVKQLHAQGLLYKGYKIQWYSPGSETVLSSHEVSLGYEEVDDPSVYVRLLSASEPDTSFLAWTTTPWTLISNAALAVHPDIEYVKARDPQRAGAYLILARERLSVLGADCEVVATFRGAELAGRRYQRLFELPANGQDESRAFRVVTAEFVSIEEGTGIVHIAPAFGADDYEVGRREGLPLYNPIRPDGRFSDAPEFIAGLWFKEADGPIMRDLRRRGLLFRQETYRHNYPHDWRKGTPLMSYPVESWFIRTTAKKDRLVALNNTIRWHPPAIGSGRFGDWLENNVDWALSRKRYWGTPLPIWISDRPGSEYFEVIGSIAELREKCGRQLPPDDEIDLHRPFVDELTWPAPDGGTMRRVPDVMDVWFDSGAMPYAQWHYPFENEDAFRRNFPADFIAEGLDQTRGWFYTLHAIAVLVSDSVAFRNVVVNGLVLDENGEKMSKSKGNTVDPFAAIAEHGADVLRWYMTANSPPWESMKFSLRGLTETRNRFFNTLANVYAFMASYANIDGFRYEEPRIPVSGRTELDRWIMSRLNTTIATVDAAFADYDPTAAARTIENFVDDLSNWYIRRSRRRFWQAKQAGRGAAASDQDKNAAYQTTFECLLAVAKLMAPLAPFFADWLYRALTAVVRCEPHASVHLADFPAIEAAAADHELEHRMALARRIVAAVLLLRNKCKYNVRQPLSRILLVTGAGGVDRDIVERVRDLILDEVNVETIEYIQDSSGIVRHTAKPSFPRLGPRVGKLMGALNRTVRTLDHVAIQQYLDSGGLDLEVDGQTVRLEAGDLEITSEPLGDWLVAQEDGLTVALDTAVTDELLAKGLARESVNRIQNMRKAMDLNLTDRIAIEYRASARLDRAIRAHAAWIRSETLALELRSSDSPSGDRVQQFEIDEEKLSVAIRRVSARMVDSQPAR